MLTGGCGAPSGNPPTGSPPTQLAVPSAGNHGKADDGNIRQRFGEEEKE